MRKKYFISTLSVLLMAAASLVQSANKPTILDEYFGDENQQLNLSFDLILDSFQIKKNSYLLLTPVVKSNTSNDSVALEQVIVMGKRKAKVLKRAAKLSGQSPVDFEETISIIRKNKTKQSYAYQVTQPLERWMYNASMEIQTEMKGCANCDEPFPAGDGVSEGDDALANNPPILVSERILTPPVYHPNYTLSYIEPDPEPVKTRSDRHTASFNYVVNRFELLRDFGSNAEEFDKVDDVIEEIVTNPDYEITEFWISGYASPEGNYNANKTLAQNRANSFANYIMDKYEVERRLFVVEGYGEDWEGLQKAVEASDLEYRDAILGIIASVPNHDARDQRIVSLDNGATYRKILAELYPPLRRTEYAIAYNVRGFNVKEAKEVIKRDPELLSLNEMYLVAHAYEYKSEEFNEVMAVSAKIYPESEVAILNVAASKIEAGAYDEAIELMEAITKKDNMWNNLGVAYAKLGNANRARELFRLATLQGDPHGETNLAELEKAEK